MDLLILLTVVPSDSSPVQPTLFILRPQLRPNAPPTPTSSKSPEVCLALDFRPTGGYMRLNGDKPLSTSNAPVSTKSKTYFFAGISDEPINTCEMNGVIKPKSDVVEGDKPTTKSPTRKVDPTVKPTKATVVPPVVRSEDVYPKRSRLNLYMLVMNGVRLLLTKALAFSTVLTVKALIF
ncbi:hypothetical protein OJAV_G00169940 [Oryzias javanicus]|uniref:Uncharacterized protein n=1 Tax=Oryzias javanicus TaxID=123683 RepID=A0A3S2P0S2_ORYJA|nr:hypothetical protein OJAV_G00169940 [Oryzias javanicus]